MDFMRWVKYQWGRVAALVLFLAGLLALLLGYLGASDSVYPAEQLPYMISGGILGIFFLGTAGILYLSADMRDEWRKLDSLEDALRRITPAGDAAPVAAMAAAEPAGPVDVVTGAAPAGAKKAPARSRSTRTAPASRS